MKLLSVNVGLPRDIPWHGQTVHTSVWKQPIEGRRMVRRLNIDGDGQGDLAGHGGEHRAVFVYQIESYRYWEHELNRSDFSFGQFGENFTVEGMADNEVCIGDRFRIASAVFEVTQPRVTCYRVGMRMNEPRMAALLVAHHRPGFYLRVLEEGEIGAGDEIIKVSEGLERLTIAAVDALLYLPAPAKGELERALRIPALSAGWKTSFEALLDELAHPRPGGGNAGLASSEQMATAAPGFRSLKVARVDRETRAIVSLVLEPADSRTLTLPRPGQFIVLRLHVKAGAPPTLRSYSLSGAPDVRRYRISVKQELNGTASTYVSTQIHPGDMLEVSEPRGAFTLGSGNLPVVLLSAGVGVTPVMAMLHVLAEERSVRPVWWVFGARSGDDHPFAQEVRELLARLPNARSHVRYSRPGPNDESGVDFDASGRLTADVVEELEIPLESAFYLCGPPAFLADFVAGLAVKGVADNRVHTEIFGSGKSITPGIQEAPRRPPHAPAGAPGDGPEISFARAGLTVNWSSRFQNLLEFAEACDVPVRWSCRAGVCHTCECGLISGSVKYDPEPLGAPAAGNVLICCSRPEQGTVIDL
jgi:ferredoxin-NADP reductase/MOSC domain-containing protein YiiM/ferredoxin